MYGTILGGIVQKRLKSAVSVWFHEWTPLKIFFFLKAKREGRGKKERKKSGVGCSTKVLSHMANCAVPVYPVAVGDDMVGSTTVLIRLGNS